MSQQEPLSKFEIDLMRSLCNAASPGPWSVIWNESKDRKEAIEILARKVWLDCDLSVKSSTLIVQRSVVKGSVEQRQLQDDLKFMAMAREIVPKLLAEIDRLTASKTEGA